MTPAMFMAPGRITTVLAPMLAMVRRMASLAPLPISIMVITAATPMIMPRVVKAARMILWRNAREAIFNVRTIFKRRLPHLQACRHPRSGRP